MNRFTTAILATTCLLLAPSCSFLKRGSTAVQNISSAASSSVQKVSSATSSRVKGISSAASSSVQKVSSATSSRVKDISSAATSKVLRRGAPDTPGSLLSEAVALEQAGKTSKAHGLYKKIVKDYALSDEAAEASFRLPESLYRQNELRDAFNDYQKFLDNYKSSSHYAMALKRQEDVAHKAADGHIKQSFLGLKSKISPSVAVKMLEQVITNAPQADSASRAQFKIAQLLQKEEKYNSALDAYQKVSGLYPSSREAPQALFNTGSLYVRETRNGNRNQANIGRAKDAFYDLVNLYPSSKLVPAARGQIKKLNQSDVMRSYETAQFYEKKNQPKAAIFYYNEVLSRAKSGSLHDLAKKKIAELGSR